MQTTNDVENETKLKMTSLSAKYTPPSWSSIPSSLSSFSVETIKEGTSRQNTKLTEKEFFVFGRSPESDFVVEHPSLSRFHCLIQFNGETNEAFLYDLGSTHGTFLNKTKLIAAQFTPLKNGDLFKLGFSSRIYVFSDTSPPMPDPKIPKDLKSKKRGHEVTWGLQEDAIQVPEQQEINWREYAEHNELTEKQKKLSEKIKKLERKKERVEMECKRIHEKEAKFDELTGVQITTLLNHEQNIELIEEEIEEVEESLQTSIHEKLFPNQSRWLSLAKEKEASESDDDMFFDRTKKAKKGHQSSQTKPVSAQDLIQEKSELKVQLEELRQEMNDSKPIAKSLPEGDSLDVYMMEMASKKEELEIQDRKNAIKKMEIRLVEIDRLLKITDPDGLLSK